MPSARWIASKFAAATAAAGAIACGGGAATLHPAHTLREGRLSAGAGASGQFVFGERAAPTGTTPGLESPEQTFLEGSVSHAAFAPGVAPWVGARIGIGGHNEGGLTYTGRTARADGRHAFGNEEVALSVGLGASVVLKHLHEHHPALSPAAMATGRFTGEQDDLSPMGFGVDLPLILGWRSTAQVVELWAGVRGGVERMSGDLELASQVPSLPPTGPLTASVGATRWYGMGLVGLSIGLRPIWVALELDAAYQAASATATLPESAGLPHELQARLSGFTLAPTGAIIGKF